MSVESALYPAQLNTAWPQAVDFISEGDDHIRLNKTVLKTTFPNVAGAINATDIQLNYSIGLTGAIQGQLDGKGAITGQTWTGTHVFPNTTTVGALTPTKQGYLATIASDVQAQINSKASATGQTWTGTHDYTGATITVPTQAPGNNTTKAASTAFVVAASLSSSLPGQAGNAGKYITTDGSTASWGAIANPFPSQTGQAGKSVVTDGTSVSWAWPQYSETAVSLAGSGVIDLSLGGRFTDTISANRTLSVSNALTGSQFTLEIYKTGGTVTFPSGTVFAAGATPDLADNKRHMLYFQRTQVGSAGWYVSANTGFGS